MVTQIINGRRSGKTTQLIGLAVLKGYDILCASGAMAESVARSADDMGYSVKFYFRDPKIVQSFYVCAEITPTTRILVPRRVDRAEGTRCLEREIVIDELDYLAARLLEGRCKVAGYTLTNENERSGRFQTRRYQMRMLSNADLAAYLERELGDGVPTDWLAWLTEDVR